MTLGKTPKILTLTPDLASYRTEMTISTSKRISTADIRTLPSELTLLLLEHDLPEDKGFVDSQRGR